MTIRTHATKAAEAALAALGAAPDEAQRNAVLMAIEKAMIDLMREDEERYAKAALNCCAPDLDTAHKIAEEVRRANTALIANLSSMR